MHFIPRKDFVVVKPNRSQETTKGGLIIPESLRRAATQGQIKAVGKFTDEKDDYKVGQHVLFAEQAGVALELDGEPVKLIGVTEIWGVVVPG